MVDQGRFGLVLWQAHQALRAALYAELAELDLSPPQYAALAHLADDPGISSAELARRAVVTAQTMQGVVVGLETRGLIERNVRAGHGRALSVWPTTQGTVVLRAANKIVHETEDRMTADLGNAEQLQLVELLRRCVATMTDPSSGGARPPVSEAPSVR